MELLTNDGWSAVNDIESILLQIRMAISSTDPRPAQLEAGPVREYGVYEAVDSYLRACAIHGWKVPAGFKEAVLAMG
jgi:ubiquitin-conjugating enzyme E2 Q